MAVVGHFALNLVRAVADTQSINAAASSPGRSPDDLENSSSVALH
jgi:hypothetical protein